MWYVWILRFCPVSPYHFQLTMPANEQTKKNHFHIRRTPLSDLFGFLSSFCETTIYGVAVRRVIRATFNLFFRFVIILFSFFLFVDCQNSAHMQKIDTWSKHAGCYVSVHCIVYAIANEKRIVKLFVDLVHIPLAQSINIEKLRYKSIGNMTQKRCKLAIYCFQSYNRKI